MSYKAKVWTALWAVYIIWGSTYLAIAVAGDTIPPLLAVSTRFIAAGALMAGVVMWRGGTLRIGRRELFWCVVIGCLLPGSNAVLFFAERDTPIGVASTRTTGPATRARVRRRRASRPPSSAVRAPPSRRTA